MMSSRTIAILTLLLMLAIGGNAFAAATVSVSPSQIPKGADSDNYFWQIVTITFGGAHDGGGADPDIVIELPADLEIADTDGGAYNDEISLGWVSADVAVNVIALGTTDVNTINLEIDDTGDNDFANGDILYVMFPVALSASTAETGGFYTFTFSDAVADPNITTAVAGQNVVTYRDAGALNVVTFTDILRADNDSTDTDGEMYPSTGGPAALFSALPDLVKDMPDAGGGFADGNVAVLDGTDLDEVTYTIWVATDSTLSHVDELQSGVLHAINYQAGGNYTLNEGGTGGASELSTSGLVEGEYYVYITSDLTGDYPLSRSGKLTVLHYPEVRILGWDYDNDGTFELGEPVGGDDESLTIDTGSYYRFDGTLAGADVRTSADIYVSVDDYDDNAQLILFYSTDSGLTIGDLHTSGSPAVVDSLSGATVLADTLYENQEDVDGYIQWNWDLVPTGTTYVPAQSYTLYAVANDGKHQHILKSLGGVASSSETISVKHSPNLTIDALTEYDLGTDTGANANVTIDPAQSDVIMISWGKTGIGGDSDIDDSCLISFYIDEDDDNNNTSDYASNQSGNFSGDTSAHLIFSGMLEDLEAKDQSYYAWNLLEDFASSGWIPNDENGGGNRVYHLYAVIDESKSGGTARVIGLGDGGLLTAGEALTIIEFDNKAPFGRMIDPPVEGMTISADQTARLRFNAFDIDSNANVGIFLLEANTAIGGVIGPPTVTVTTELIAATAAALTGVSYCITDNDGDPAAGGVWESENTSTYFDFTPFLPGDNAGGGTSRYDTDMDGDADALADGEYWVYIGVDNDNDDFGDDETLYRAPGTITITGIATVPAQRNAILTPTNFTAVKGDTITVSLRAADEGVTVDIMDFYVAVEKGAFTVVSPGSPFTDSVPTGSLIANEAIDDSTGNRWILHATAYNDGGAIGEPANTDLGSVMATFRVVSLGTDNAVSETGGIYFVNEPANGWVTSFSNDGVPMAVDYISGEANVVPRGIVEGIVEFQGRDTSDYNINLQLRKRGSYVAETDADFVSRNDADANSDGIQIDLDSDGKFSLFQVPTGEWDLVVSYPRYFSKLQQVSIYPGLDTLFVSFGTLYGGDCVGYTDSSGAAYPDNEMHATDITRIKDAYLDTPDSTRWDDGTNNYKWADIDESGKVEINDLTMATQNLALWATVIQPTVAQPIYKAAVGPASTNLNSTVELVNVPEMLNEGQVYTMQVIVRGAGDLAGYFVDLNYDRNVFTLEGIEEGNIFDVSTESFPTFGAGTIGISSAPYDAVSFAGDGLLAEVTFRAVSDVDFTADMVGIREATFVNSMFVKENIIMNETTIVSESAPVAFAVSQNFPNPFNPTTTINYTVPNSGFVTLKIYDILGRHVATLIDGAQSAGSYNAVWNATDLNGNTVSNGVYFYTVQAGRHRATKRMLLLK